MVSPSPPSPATSTQGLAAPYAVVYGRWVDTWEAALAALASASHSRTLSTNEAATHKAAIAAEREVVIGQLTLLLGHAPEPAEEVFGAR
jgi:hypothetical protein